MSGKELSYTANILDVLMEQNVELRHELDKEKMRSEKDCEKIVRSIKVFVNDKLQTAKRQDEK